MNQIKLKYYLKIAFGNKIKKYSISSLKEIKFQQIKQGFGIKQKWKDCLFFYQIVDDFGSNDKNPQNRQYTEEQLAQFLSTCAINQKSTIKLRILQKTLMSEQQKRRKQSDESLQVPTIVVKKRSRSMQLQHDDVFQETCRTQVFDPTVVIWVKPTNINNEFLNEKDQSLRFSERQIFGKSIDISSNNLSSSITVKPSDKTVAYIKNCLHESIRVTQKQKSELEALKEKIAKRQKQLNKEDSFKKVEEVFLLLGFEI